MDTVDYFPIEVEEVSWQSAGEQLTAIRHKVFVEEQGVPVAEEVDDLDPTAMHWIAFGPGNVAMATARMLPDGQVGRMAVLKPYRQRGVGSSIMRNIIRYAIREGKEQLVLSAQLHAIPFYEGFGFISDGKEYLDAGIPHRTMVLNLHRFMDNAPKPLLREISDEERQRVGIEGVDEFRDQAVMLVERAQREIRIFTFKLEPGIYANNQFCDAIYSFATSHPLARVRILVKDLAQVIHQTPQLHELCLRLPSRIQIRKLETKEDCLHTEFMLVDRTGILYKQEPERFVGYVVPHAPLEAVELVEEFDNLWEQGELDPDLRRLHI
ncbi:GNAT family N-acetyltransferase [Porticoccus sp.]